MPPIHFHFSWKNVYDSKNLVNVGPNVIALHENSVVKFTHLVTGVVSYFRAETAVTGLNIKNFAGHNRFPLFAFDESVLCPQIFVYKYPEMVRYATLQCEYFKNIVFNISIFMRLTFHSFLPTLHEPILL